MAGARTDYFSLMSPQKWRHRVFPAVGYPPIPHGKERIAYHEAGHAVASLVLGLPCHSATAADSEGAFLGHGGMPGAVREALTLEQKSDVLLLGCKVHQPDGDENLRKENLAIMLVAGLQAEMIFAGVSFDGAVFANDQDHYQARYLLNSAETPPTFGYCQLYAHRLLQENLALVVQIASELLRCGAWQNENQ